MNRITYPPTARGVVDVTQAPYFLDNTGKKDCTAGLVALLDETARASMEGMKRVMDRLEAETDPEFKLPGSFENCRRFGRVFGIFPDRLPPSRILYFPHGTYLVSDTVCYSMDNLRNGMGSEMAWCIRFQGESRDGSIIRLKDGSHGFEYGMSRPVVSFMRGPGSNIGMSNFFRNLTIDTGRGNPGAVGLDFFGNNCAGVRDVLIRSGDPEGRGMAGLTVSRSRTAAVVFKNVEIHGFEVGLRLDTSSSDVVCENIVLKGQRDRGLLAHRVIACVRNLRSENVQPAVKVDGHDTHLVLLDAVLEGGDPIAPAIERLTGQLFMRNITTAGYQCALGMSYGPGWGTEPILEETDVDEYVSGPVCTLAPGQEGRSLNLPIEDAPVMAWDSDFSHWTHPGEYGAVGDGITDDTAAIQRAMDSGKPVVFFQPGQYLIDAPVRIPATVRKVHFMFVDLVSGDALRGMHGRGMFTVDGESSELLLMQDLFSFERNYGNHYLIEHACRRPLHLRDLHVQSCAAYRNSVRGGTVFMENIISTTGIFDDTYQQPCFEFNGQTAWCRQLDPEYTPDKIINDGSQLWILGFKTEGEGIAITTRNGGKTEALGGILYFGPGTDTPAVLNDESDVSLVASTSGTFSPHLFKVAVREVMNGESRVASHEQFPLRYAKQYCIPLYTGKKSSSA